MWSTVVLVSVEREPSSQWYAIDSGKIYGGVQVVSDITASDLEKAQELDDIDQRGLWPMGCCTTINYWRRETYDKAFLWLGRCEADKPDTAQLIYLPSSTASAVASAVIDLQAARLTIVIPAACFTDQVKDFLSHIKTVLKEVPGTARVIIGWGECVNPREYRYQPLDRRSTTSYCEYRFSCLQNH